MIYPSYWDLHASYAPLVTQLQIEVFVEGLDYGLNAFNMQV